MYLWGSIHGELIEASVINGCFKMIDGGWQRQIVTENYNLWRIDITTSLDLLYKAIPVIHSLRSTTYWACMFKVISFLKRYISLSLLIKIRTVLNSYTSFKIYKYTVIRKSSANLPWYDDMGEKVKAQRKREIKSHIHSYHQDLYEHKNTFPFT